MRRERYIVISFQTTTKAMLFEKKCKEENKEGRLIPLPPQIDAGCGLAWGSKHTSLEEWIEYLNINSLDYDKISEVMI